MLSHPTRLIQCFDNLNYYILSLGINEIDIQGKVRIRLSFVSSTTFSKDCA